MPLHTITLKPGVNSEVTPTLGEAQIVQSQLIRFKNTGNQMLVEKLGGWQKFYPNALTSPIRDLHAWEGLRADAHLGVGAEQTLAIISNGLMLDVTPRTVVTNNAVDFATTNTSPTVTIHDAGITVSTYDSIWIDTPVAVGGLILSGGYVVASVVDASHYTITASTNATSTVVSGGAVPTFTTTNGSPTITVTLTAHGYAVGEIFNVPIPCATSVGGVTVVGAYVIQTVPTADTFTINTAASATSAATVSENGGNARITYFVGIGPPATAVGYGGGGYGTGAYGIGVVPPPSAGSPITATNWSLDNWGEVLLACPADGAIYQYSPDLGVQNATKIVAAPEINGGIFVSQPAQILVAWASSNGGVQDPLIINWSDAGDYTNWTVSSITQAGGYHIPTGSRIVGGMSGPNFSIIWTDVGVWAMDYIEPPLIFGFNSLGDNCGLIARHAACTLNSIVYWMSNDKFCAMAGEAVQTLPCSVWDVVFQDLDTAHSDKIYCSTNSLFGEVWWFYPSKSGGTGEVDSYVKIIPEAGVWDYGKLARSAWIDQSPVGAPVAGSPNGYIYQHETSPDADGQPMDSWFQTGYFELDDSEQLQFVDWILPDFRYGYYPGQSGAIVQLSVLFTDYPNGATVKTRGPYSVTNTTNYVNTRLRGRYTALRIESQDLGSFWRMGSIKIRGVGDGRR